MAEEQLPGTPSAPSRSSPQLRQRSQPTLVRRQSTQERINEILEVCFYPAANPTLATGLAHLPVFFFFFLCSTSQAQAVYIYTYTYIYTVWLDSDSFFSSPTLRRGP